MASFVVAVGKMATLCVVPRREASCRVCTPNMLSRNLAHPRLYVCQAPGALICVSPCGSKLGPGFWVHSGCDWTQHGCILGPFWIHFGSILGSLRWGPIGVQLGSILVIVRMLMHSESSPRSNKNQYLVKNQHLNKNP